jgi:hypothetical protein
LIPILSNLLNLSGGIEGYNVDLRQKVSASRLEVGTGTYDRESDNAIRQEVVIQAGEVCAASGEKFERGLDLRYQRVSAVDHVQELLLLLLKLASLTGKVLDDFRRAIEGDERGNVVERRVVSQEFRIRSSQELPVCSLKRHDDGGFVYSECLDGSRRRWQMQEEKVWRGQIRNVDEFEEGTEGVWRSERQTGVVWAWVCLFATFPSSKRVWVG